MNRYYLELAIEERDATIANRAYQPVRLSERDLIETFGKDGIAIAKENIKYYKARIEELNSDMIEYLTGLYNNPKYKLSFKDLMSDYAREVFAEKTKEIERRIKRLERLVACSSRKETGNSITPDDVARAKAEPIENFVEFNRANKTLCLWHSDKNPSMHYYRKRNRVHCFSCDANKDVIDVVQELHKVEFLDAVKIILGR